MTLRERRRKLQKKEREKERKEGRKERIMEERNWDNAEYKHIKKFFK